MVAFKKILFPTDFSANADKALAHAIRLADFDNGEVIVQHVVGNYFEKHPHWATLFDVHELQKFMDGYVTAQMAKVVPKNSGKVRIRTLISKGKPADEIAAAADREAVDLVVMGSAKGVVTNKVIRMTGRPVLAVSANQPALRTEEPEPESDSCIIRSRLPGALPKRRQRLAKPPALASCEPSGERNAGSPGVGTRD
jgi:nucleotide-binding universal stress UspA family protein